MNFDELANETKSQFYEKCDIRLKAFFAAATLKSNKYQKHHDNIKELANIYENLLKACNFRYTLPVGVRDNIIAYIGSDKSNQTTQVLCKAGAKGSKPILEQILQNTEDKNKFEATIVTYQPLLESMAFMFSSQYVNEAPKHSLLKLNTLLVSPALF